MVSLLFLVFPSINSVIPFHCLNDNLGIENTSVGEEVIIVTISEINGQYYSSFTSTIIVTNHVENITMSPTTLNDINQAINNL